MSSAAKLVARFGEMYMIVSKVFINLAGKNNKINKQFRNNKDCTQVKITSALS